MAVRDVLLHPHPMLKVVSGPVAKVNGPVLLLIKDLMDTMRAGPRSVGIAAPQIGVAARVCIVDVSKNPKGLQNNHGLMVMVNPEIIERSGAVVVREGCMSVPEYTGDVERAANVVVAFADDEGTRRKVETEGFEAVVVQHEIDHLDGYLFLDRIVSLKTGLFRRKANR